MDLVGWGGGGHSSARYRDGEGLSLSDTLSTGLPPGDTPDILSRGSEARDVTPLNSQTWAFPGELCTEKTPAPCPEGTQPSPSTPRSPALKTRAPGFPLPLPSPPLVPGGRGPCCAR